MEIDGNFGRTLDDLAFAGSQRAAPASLGQEDFLRLMIEQLRNQNPLEPVDNSQFFSQMAQFDQLDTMHEIANALRALASSSELANASALVGRSVTAEVPLGPDPETGFPRDPDLVVGAVERVTFELDGPVVHIDGRAVPVGFITEVA